MFLHVEQAADHDAVSAGHPGERATHLPYTPLLLASPVIAVASWAAAGIGIAWWIWRHAPLIDDTRPI